VTLSDKTATLKSDGSADMHGSQSTVHGHATYNYKITLTTQQVNYKNSANLTTWEGSHPFYAQAIQGSMTWSVSGLQITIDSGGVGSMHQSGHEETWEPPATVSTKKHKIYSQALTDPSGPDFTSHVGIIYGTKFNTAASVELGGSWYHVRGH
jgi:hypothetical protein